MTIPFSTINDLGISVDHQSGEGVQRTLDLLRCVGYSKLLIEELKILADFGQPLVKVKSLGLSMSSLDYQSMSGEMANIRRFVKPLLGNFVPFTLATDLSCIDFLKGESMVMAGAKFPVLVLHFGGVSHGCDIDVDQSFTDILKNLGLPEQIKPEESEDVQRYTGWTAAEGGLFFKTLD